MMMGGGIKLLPFSLAPISGWKGGILGLILIALLGIPMWQSAAFEGLQTYLEHWSFNASFYPIVHHVFPSHSRFILLSIWMCTIGIVLLSNRNTKTPNVGGMTLSIFVDVVLCSPTAHPWYALWIFPFAILLSVQRFGLCCVHCYLYLITLC